MKVAETTVLTVILVLSVGCSSGPRQQPVEAGLPAEIVSALDGGNVRECLSVLRGRKDISPEIYGALEARARSDDKCVALVALTVLGRMPDKGQRRVLEDVAGRSGDRLVRCQAMYCMGVLRDPTGVPFLLRVLGSPTEGEYERRTAAVALAIVRDGILDDVPLWVQGAVFLREPAKQGDPFKVPTLESLLTEFTQWWSSNRGRLLGERERLVK